MQVAPYRDCKYCFRRCFGILKGLIAVYFIGIILLLLSANSKQNTSFYEAVNNSAIITIIQNHSIVPIG